MSQRVVGYCAIYNSLSEDMGFRESIRAGAFDKALARADLDALALVNHNTDAMLGRTSAGTLRLQSDSRGLRAEIDLPKTQLGLDIYEQIKRRDYAAMSFAFTIGPEGEDWQVVNGELRRELIEVRTIEDCSIVSRPAYKATSVTLDELSRSTEVAMSVNLLRHQLNSQ